jgi:hypothetical protein
MGPCRVNGTIFGTLSRDPKNHGNVLCFQSLGGNGLQKSPTSYNILEYPSIRDWDDKALVDPAIYRSASHRPTICRVSEKSIRPASISS